MPNRAQWMKFIVSILLGNALYFALLPRLPSAAQHHKWTVDLGTVVDFWFCLMVYGLLELAAYLQSPRRGPDGPKR